jgi:hypothetical protein
MPLPLFCFVLFWFVKQGQKEKEGEEDFSSSCFSSLFYFLILEEDFLFLFFFFEDSPPPFFFLFSIQEVYFIFVSFNFFVFIFSVFLKNKKVHCIFGPYFAKNNFFFIILNFSPNFSFLMFMCIMCLMQTLNSYEISICNQCHSTSIVSL